MNYYGIRPEDKIIRKEKFQGYTIIEYETTLGFRFFDVNKKEKYLSTFQVRTEAKEYIKRIIKQKHEALYRTYKKSLADTINLELKIERRQHEEYQKSQKLQNQ